MSYFKNTIITLICIGVVLVIQGIAMSSQTAPTILLKLGKLLFNIIDCFGAIVLAFFLVNDLKEYFKDRWY